MLAINSVQSLSCVWFQLHESQHARPPCPSARRERKAFLSDQCKEIEENCRLEKTKDLFKKIRDTMVIFHAKDGLNKVQKRYEPEAEAIRGGKNTQKNCMKKSFTTQIIMMVRSLI